MGSRGPAKKPTHLKILNGNPGKQKLNLNEPKPDPIAPDCPDWLDDGAKEEWKRLSPELEKMGLLTKVDRSSFAGYCQAYSRWREAEEFMQKHGTFFKTQSGYLQQLPQVSIAQKYLAIMRNFCHEFGLSPSARSAIQMADKAGDGDDFFFK